ncbi:hypothetical protein GCM10011577_40320 [Pseudarthrobacter polychromogenes]|uniref:Rhamnosyl transferase n=2 Tax=Pseudarthrobacter polychromogenes TaxID=1676 RepID=A0ABQ1Y3K1_9MICC|nr:hypothetical protein GCM10011577_40320 [Pseudarthrobacter polychromogenes]
MSQTNKGFRWLIYFDAERDDWFEKEVERLSDGAFEPIWIEGTLTPEKAAAAVANRARAPWVITTRMDNDDAIARDFIDAVQAQFGHEDHQFINFQSGLQLSDKGEVFHRSDPSGPFISLIEKRSSSPLKGVYVGRHDRISEYGPIRQVVAPPMWLQMVHGLNIGNELRGIRAAPELVNQYFDIQLKPVEISKIQLRIGQVVTASKLVAHVLRRPHRVLWVIRVAANRVFGKTS